MSPMVIQILDANKITNKYVKIQILFDIIYVTI